MNWKILLIVVGIVLPVFVILSIQGGVNRDKYQKNKPLPEWYVKYIEPVSETLTLLMAVAISTFSFSDFMADTVVSLPYFNDTGLYLSSYYGFGRASVNKIYYTQWKTGFILGAVIYLIFIGILSYYYNHKRNSAKKTLKMKYVDTAKWLQFVLLLYMAYPYVMDTVVYNYLMIRYDVIWYLLIKWILFFVIVLLTFYWSRDRQKQSVQADE